MKRSNLDNWICETEHLPALTRSVLEELQLSRLNQLLSRVHAAGGFYRQFPTTLNSLQELQLLPFTTPEMLAENSRNLLLTSQSLVSRVISGATSGTTGPSKRIFYTGKDTAHTISFFAAGIAEMVHPGETVLIAFPFSGAFSLGDLIEQAVQFLGARSLRMGDKRTYRDIGNLIAAEKPDCYIGFPVLLLSLARMYPLLLKQAGDCCPVFPIKRALISGDTCARGVITALEQKLQSRLFPHYGSREMVMGGAITCPAHEGMHLRENHIIAEIIGKDLSPVPDGEWGELVITTIGMEAMPLIRYRTGDRARFLPDPCPCQSVTRRLDMVSRAENGPVSIETLDNLLFPIDALVDYRAEVNGNTLTVNVNVLNDRCRPQILEALGSLASSFKILVRENICQPDDTPLYPGKRYVIHTSVP